MLTSRKVSALALLLCCADAATINVHAVSFSQPLCCANFYKDIYSSNMSVETKYCKIGHFNFMFWSLKIKYTLQVCIHLPLQCFCQRKLFLFLILSQKSLGSSGCFKWKMPINYLEIYVWLVILFIR